MSLTGTPTRTLDFHKNRFMAPVQITDNQAYTEEWICYKSDLVVPRLKHTVKPGEAALIKDEAAYGMILLQGRGSMGAWEIETPAPDPVRSADQ